MKVHKAILDIAARLVHLNSPVYGKVTLHLHVVAHIKASLHHVVERKLEDIHVVQECLLKEPSSSRLNCSPVPLQYLRLRTG
jgi:hypothetical protein